MTIAFTESRHEGSVAQQRSGIIRFLAAPAILMAAVLCAALIYWLWFGLTQRSITDAEGISILAAQGILEHGYSQLPSGFVYYRALIPSYLLAGSILAFGLNDFSVMLPGVLMALGSQWLTFRFSKDILRNPWIGIAAAIVLVSLQVETYYATSGRMYMALQFFALLTIYSAWRGYIEGEAKFQWITVLALIAAILSHRIGAAMLIAVPASVLVVLWIRRQGRPRVNVPLAIIGLVVGFCLIFGPMYFGLPGGIPQIASRGGVDADLNQLNLDVIRWIKHLGRLELTVPLGLLLMPSVAFLACRALKNIRNEISQAHIYVLLLLGLFAGAIVTNIGQNGSRFWMAVLPIYVLTLLSGLVAFGNWIITGRGDSVPSKLTWRIGATAAMVGLVLLAVLGPFLAGLPVTYWDLAREAYGPPCGKGICSKTIEEEYAALHKHLSSEDVIISSNHQVTSYYLGRVDGWLREQGNNTVGFSTFDSPTDEYLGVALIDSIEKLRQLRDSDRRVWIIADPKINQSSSQQTRDFLKAEYAAHANSPGLTIYVNHP